VPAKPCPSVLELTTSIARGDDAALRQFFEEYHLRLYRYLLVAAHGNDSLAQEALQNAFLRIVRHMKPCADADRFWRWLTRVARTALIDEARMQQRREARHLAAAQTAADAGCGWAEDGTIALTAALDICLGELAPMERELVDAFYFHRATQAEIAAAHSLTEKAIESRLARIRHRLRTLVLERLHHAQL
jgi:RNA polymerase sigma-70 factor, ECF subfamily